VSGSSEWNVLQEEELEFMVKTDASKRLRSMRASTRRATILQQQEAEQQQQPQQREKQQLFAMFAGVCGAATLADHVTKVDNGDYFICLAYCRSCDGTGTQCIKCISMVSSVFRGMPRIVWGMVMDAAAAPVAPHDT